MKSGANILLLFPDQWRSDWLGAPLRTPVLDALAARGMRFDQCITPSPLCAPARASLAQGCGYTECGVASNDQDLPLDRRTFYQVLRNAGYAVGGVGKFDLAKSLQNHGGDGKRLLSEWGFDFGIDSEGKWDGAREMSQFPLTGPYGRYLESLGLRQTYLADIAERHGDASYANTRPSPLGPESYGDNWVARNAVDCLAAFPAGRPWFLQVNFPGPHEPLDAPGGVLDRLAGDCFPPALCHTNYSPEKMQQIRRSYSAMTTNIDALCGQILDAVARRGDADNTFIVFSSDHGESLGDYDCWAKITWHEPSIRVPLIVAGPGVARGRSAALVQLQDLSATFFELADAGALATSSRSFSRVLRDPSAAHRPILRSALGDWRATMDRQWKLVESTVAEPRLHRRTADAPDATDVADRHPDIVEHLFGATNA